MTDIETTVAECFENVFADLAPGDAARCSQASYPKWDSLAHVTLLSAVSEQFGLDIPPDVFEELTSYPLIVDYVQSQRKS